MPPPPSPRFARGRHGPRSAPAEIDQTTNPTSITSTASSTQGDEVPTTPKSPPKAKQSDDGYCDGSDSSPSPIPPRRLRTISASDRFCRNSKLRHNVFKSPTIDAADAYNLNAPLIDHDQPEKTNAAWLPRVSTGLCPVCGRSFKLTNLGVLFVHGPRDLRCSGSGSPPQLTEPFVPETPQITTDSISIPDIVRFLPRNVLKRIPKGARYQVAKAFTGLVNDCLQTNCVPSWTRLFAFPRLVLCTSGDSGVSLTSTIKERLASFEQIFNDFERNLREVRKGRTKEEFRCRFSKRSLTERVSSKLADG
ncbi:hypothetical protein ACOME3_008558, partial [Neoechinorhynchus agilis]